MDPREGGEFESTRQDQGPGDEPQRELDQALEKLRGKIDESAGKLKDKLGDTVYQIEDVIDGADQVLDRLLQKVNSTAGETRQVLESAEKLAERLENPIGLVQKYPMAALTGAVVGGMALGLFLRVRSEGKMSKRHLKVAP